jgi:hypothetical protein
MRCHNCFKIIDGHTWMLDRTTFTKRRRVKMGRPYRTT